MASDYPSHAGTNGTSTDNSGFTNNAQSQTSAKSDVPKEEVAWYFVEQYYKTLSGSPEKLYLFFNKRSQYVSGTEAEKISVAVGQKSISERIKDMDFRETKVRVTNVDSQASDSNTIVIQVIGEMTTKSEEPKKFVQTFVLASQTNGYFVLNDIFRYIADEEEDEPVEAEQEQSELIHKDEPAKVEETIKEVEHEKETTAAPAVVADDKAVEQVDQKLEEVAKEQETAPAEPETNGVHAEEESAPAAVPEEEKAHVAEAVAEETIAEPEKPKDPVPSPKAAPTQPKAAPTPSAPPKPAVPKSWAQLAAGNKAAQAAAAAAAAPSSNNSQAAPTQSTQAKTAPVSSTSQNTQAAVVAPAAASSSAAPAREPSPVDSQKTGSENGGWQMAGDNHSRGKARQAPAAPAQQQNDGRVRAYVKNVYQSVNADELKAHLGQFGEVVYFDVSRAKNSAFIEYSTRAAFEAALAANPHKIGNDTVFIEERRLQGGGPFRGGGAPRGRGGFEGQGRGGRGGGQGAPRGSFQGRGDRGGRGGGAPRGRGAPAAA